LPTKKLFTFFPEGVISTSCSQEDAETLYKNVGRYDLLNKMYQNSNRWDEALRVAETHDRIHLRNTYDVYGRHLEQQGDIQGAIRMFEMANTHRKHVPRLLLRNFAALDKYIQKSEDS
jgi:intraflagellar transport protein 140